MAKFVAVNNLSIESLEPKRNVKSGEIVDLTGLPADSLKILLDMGAIAEMDKVKPLIADVDWLNDEQKNRLHFVGVYYVEDILNLNKIVVVGNPADPVLREKIGNILVSIAPSEDVMTDWVAKARELVNPQSETLAAKEA